jgi:hypothetical protein
MRTVNLNKIELLDIVRKNKDAHAQQYAESVEDYKVAVTKITKANVKLATTGDLAKIAQIKSIPSKPVSYEDAYVRAIRMLELSVDETIELEEHIFNQLVLDEWSWKQNFVATSALYKTI